MIKLKLGDLVNSVGILQRLAQMDFKAKTSWQVSKLLTAAEKEIQTFNEARMKVVQKYGEKDANGELITNEEGNCQIPAEVGNDFANEINELLMSEVELNVSSIPLEDLDTADFKPTDMVIMEPFLKVEE